VALARAFLRERPLLLLDEPFAALGPALRREMTGLLAALREARRAAAPLAVVMVTHHPGDARGRADRTAFVDRGRVAAVGPTAEMLDAPAGPAAAYLGTADPKEAEIGD
jgi:thiamine transport system ATP-binding protein